MQVNLSEDEKRILEMIVGNMSPSEIAFALDIEQAVIIETSECIFQKLKVSDFQSAAETATKLKLVKTEL